MADDTPGPGGLIASRLDLLFRTVHPADRGPYSIAEVVKAINASGDATISVGYLWQLRKGHGDNPTYKHLLVLSRFFGVSPMYFFPEEDAARGAVPADAALALKDDAVREIALRAAALSERSLQVIRDNDHQRPRPGHVAAGHPAPHTATSRDREERHTQLT
jgi:hypothetical protein